MVEFEHALLRPSHIDLCPYAAASTSQWDYEPTKLMISVKQGECKERHTYVSWPFKFLYTNMQLWEYTCGIKCAWDYKNSTILM